jgi:hypothetical protein
MTNSPRATQIDDPPSEPSIGPVQGDQNAQGKHLQEVQGEAPLLADILAEARAVLAQQGPDSPPQKRVETGPIREAAKSVRAIPTFMDTEKTPEEVSGPALLTPDPLEVILSPVHVESGLPRSFPGEKGLCSEERMALIEPMADFESYDPETGRQPKRSIPWLLGLMVVPHWCGPWRRRALNIAAITLACWVPVTWGYAVFMPSPESPRVVTANLHVDPLLGPLSVAEAEPTVSLAE